MSNIDAHLEINPEAVIEFVFSEDEVTTASTNGGTTTPSKVIMTLRHPDPESGPIAFKVKTTQPRRYLVRPNQGLLLPGKSEQIQILLVDKDKAMLLQTYQRLGATGLDHSKDKFLVQSVVITDPYKVEQLHDYEQLTALWTSLSSAGSSNATGIANKKLSVKFKVVPSLDTPLSTASAGVATTLAAAQGGGISPSSGGLVSRAQPASSNIDITKLSQNQLVEEYKGLRRKYDELVAFSVNLTAERDILNNTLEQTKRDLNRQIAKNAANENISNANAVAGASAGASTPSKFGRRSNGKAGAGSATNKFSIIGFLLQLVLYYVMIGLGAQLYQYGVINTSGTIHIPIIDKTVPILPQAFFSSFSSTSTKTATTTSSTFREDEL